MDLQQHPHLIEPRLGERRSHPHHRALDDIGAGPLDRRIDCGAFGALAFVLHLGLDPREMRLPPEQGGRVAALANLVRRLGDIAVDTREALEIAVDHRLRLLDRHVEPTREPPARNAVENCEVDRLGAAPRVAVDLAKQFLRGHAVNIGPARKCLLERGHIGHVRGEAQFDLAVIGGKNDASRICRPISVRIGMFCRFGSVEDRRPV